MTDFINLLKATRIYRTLPILMAILVPAAFANIITREIFILSLSGVLIYSVAGIHNAIKDKDYPLPSYSRKAMLILLSIAVIVSLSNYIVFLTALVSIILGLIYNTTARFFLFGDSTILSISHFALPCFSSSILLGLDIELAILLSTSLFLIAWFITPTKNLKDTKEDKNRKYVTLTTTYHNGIIITKILLLVSFVIMSGFYFLFNLTTRFILILILVFYLIIIALKKINNKEEKQGLGILRLVILFFMFGLIIEKTSNIFIIFLAFLLCLLYVFYLSFPKINKIMIKLQTTEKWIQK